MTYQYQLIANSPYILRIDEDGLGSFIPNDPSNSDWQAYQVWLAAGNTPQAPN